MDDSLAKVLVLAGMSLLPFLVATGTCFLKFTVVFTLLRNGLGLQQVPSNVVINALALMLAAYVMQPVIADVADAFANHSEPLDHPQDVIALLNEGSGSYRAYLARHADADLVRYFAQLRASEPDASEPGSWEEPGLFELLPAYALSELKAAFLIGFYLYLPFVVVDLVVSGILLSLGMMMMSPVTISAPIKLVLFVALDGWTLISKGLIEPYLSGGGH
ncbi:MULTISPECIES: EscR/YscR/HrcR family type III secretion system export apparatus protein [Dyella]|uniref:EscR/YscR/HrcR family type III secretion system export apparatus protein n=2 Tax=Dyella TaxID=231454 RepID=A0A4R0Z1L3_9GAMM|nr:MULTISPECIES: EscR/YscR/HrcR family type III secretion system export apparatus protein [Dyella]TBR38730.1 EscR/YscR/HrcR family type III secretion system export apparatus protein [Dyella terrae]TCI13679.1 EscR/YscR/HrcR family type III secretion system export apparatus protein [Dyella soli]